MARFKLDLQGTENEIEITRQGDFLHITRGEQSCDLILRRQEGPSFVLEILLPDGTRKRIRAAGQAQGDQRQMWVNGQYFSYTRIRRRGSGSSVDGTLSSSIPAVVTQILVSIGDTVTEGDKLILLESMKMIIPIHAPGNGTIKAILCAAGESVQAGNPLIELEEIDNDK